MSPRIIIILSIMLGLYGCTLAERIQNKLGSTQNEPAVTPKPLPTPPAPAPTSMPQDNRLNEVVIEQQTQLQQLKEEQARHRVALKRMEQTLITNFELLERSVSEALDKMQTKMQELSANLNQSLNSTAQQPFPTESAPLKASINRSTGRSLSASKNPQKAIEDYSLFSPKKPTDSQRNETTAATKVTQQKSLVPIPLPPKNQIIDERQTTSNTKTQKPLGTSSKVLHNTDDQPFTDPNLKEPEAPYKLKSRPQVKKLYDQGMDAMINRKYPHAIQSFQDMLKQFPDDEYSDNALFWLGHIHFTLNQLNEAEAAFHKVLSQYEHRPTSQGYKTPDAIYMLGKISESRNDNNRSAYYFQEVVKRFPGSTAASNAEENLKSLE